MMNSFFSYFQGIYEGVKSLLIGMRTSIRIFFRHKITEQYPENRATLHISERFRGRLVMPHDENNQHNCIACGLCSLACPNDTIKVISDKRELEDGKTQRYLVKYEYDLGCCIFCQLCVNVCPHDAIRFTNDFENAVYTRSKLVQQLNQEGSTCKK
jgi:NADH-quinone oxidoreductase subunit I